MKTLSGSLNFLPVDPEVASPPTADRENSLEILTMYFCEMPKKAEVLLCYDPLPNESRISEEFFQILYFLVLRVAGVAAPTWVRTAVRIGQTEFSAQDLRSALADSCGAGEEILVDVVIELKQRHGALPR